MGDKFIKQEKTFRDREKLIGKYRKNIITNNSITRPANACDRSVRNGSGETLRLSGLTPMPSTRRPEMTLKCGGESVCVFGRDELNI